MREAALYSPVCPLILKNTGKATRIYPREFEIKERERVEKDQPLEAAAVCFAVCHFAPKLHCIFRFTWDSNIHLYTSFVHLLSIINTRIYG